MGGHQECKTTCPNHSMHMKNADTPPTPKIRRAGALKGKAVMRLINHDMIRDLLIPSECPNKYAAVFPKSQLESIKSKAKHMTLQDKMELCKKEEQKRKEQMEESAKLRIILQDHDAKKKPDSVDRSCDKELQQPNYALARAYELRQEQDDDIKKFNSVILGTKCHAIREAQVAEKKLIEKQLKEEDRRLDDMMEQERRKSILKSEDSKKNDKGKKQEYVKNLIAQIRDKEITKLLDAEHIEDESRRMQEANNQMQMEELENRRKQRTLQEKIRKDLADVNSQLKLFRELEREEEKIQELRLKESHRQKAELEESRELTLKAQALAHNQAFAKIWCQQKKEHDMRDKLNDLHEQRIQDEIERSWREKEQMAARKRFEINEKLKVGREAQIEDTRRMRALEMAREKQEYENVLRAQQEAAQREGDQEKNRKKESELYLRALLSQMHEKEQARIREKQNGYEEGISMKVEADCHDRQIKTIMQKKVEQLRIQHIPEQYVMQVQRRIDKSNKKFGTK